MRDGTPKGIRIPVYSVKGSCPRPLDDGGLLMNLTILKASIGVKLFVTGILFEREDASKRRGKGERKGFGAKDSGLSAIRTLNGEDNKVFNQS